MLVSSNKKFIFYHIPKTAGKSFEDALGIYSDGKPGLLNAISRRLPGYLDISPAFFYKYRTFDSHINFIESECLLPEKVINSYYKFSIVRNPYDRFVSFYHYLLKQKNHPWFNIALQAGSFSGMVKKLKDINEPTQRSYIVNGSGKIKMDFIGRFENINEDFQKICLNIGIEARLDRINSNHHPDYRNLYNEEDREIVYCYFKEDFEEFHYKK
jgi:hypothetical protein